MSDKLTRVIERYIRDSKIDKLIDLKTTCERKPEKYNIYIEMINTGLDKLNVAELESASSDENCEEEEVRHVQIKKKERVTKYKRSKSEKSVDEDEELFNHPQRAKSIRKDKLTVRDFMSLKIGESVYYRINTKKSNKLRTGIYLGHYLDIYIISKSNKSAVLLEKKKYILLK